MTTQNRNGGAFAAAGAVADVTDAWLRDRGRLPVNKLVNGNIRTYMWANPGDGSVPAKFEHMRLYSKPHDYGTSRGLEASDMVHVLKSIDEAKAFAADMNWRESPISVLDPRSVFETVVRVRRRRPEKTFVSGNVAVLVWVNQADDDLVTKTEFFTVIDPGAVVRGFGVEAIDDVRRCYARAAQFVDELHAELQQTTLNTTRRRR